MTKSELTIDIYKLQICLDYQFKNEEILKQAMTHSSYVREKNLPRYSSNERLEFIGDGFLDAIIAEELYRRLPRVTEGELSKYRSQIVCESALADLGRELTLGDFFYLGRGEEVNGGRNRISALADGVEATIGAMYLDGGYEITQKWVLSRLEKRIVGAIDGNFCSDYKSELQEWQQQEKKSGCKIIYKLDHEEGPDHDKTFFVKVMIDGMLKGQGSGKSKKEAEQQAAKVALERGTKNVF